MINKYINAVIGLDERRSADQPGEQLAGVPNGPVLRAEDDLPHELVPCLGMLGP